MYHTQPASKPASAAISPAPAQNLFSTSAKILIVEDGVAAAATLQKNLLRHYRVDSDIANDGLNALDKIKTHDYALILMDIGLPDTTGIELTKTIRALTIPQATVPIVAITGHANNPQIAKEALSSGMQAVLDKPPGCDELNIMLKRYVFNKQSTEETIPAVVIDWADHLALFDNDEAFTKQLFVMLSESLVHFKETLATYSEHDKALRFELHKVAGEVAYFTLPPLQGAIINYQQVLMQDPEQASKITDATQALLETIDAYLVAVKNFLI